MPIALLALTLSAFAIGTTEFVIVGLLPTIGADLGVSLPSAGLLVSLYALGVAIGAPVLTALTGKVPRKLLLLSLMVLFTLGNLLAWMAPSYESLVLARIVTGLAHGVFFSIGSTIATSLVPKEKAASAIAIMFTGLTVALVTGVPLGTFIGQHFGWRETFLAVSALGVIAFIGSLLYVPNNIAHSKPASLLQQLQVLKQPRLLLVYAMTAIGYGGSFIAFTFLAPILQDISGFSAGTVSQAMEEVATNMQKTAIAQEKTTLEFEMVSENLNTNILAIQGVVQKLSKDILSGLKAVSESGQRMVSLDQRYGKVSEMLIKVPESLDALASVVTRAPVDLQPLLQSVNQLTGVANSINKSVTARKAVKA